MKILYFTTQDEDYLQDQILMGLRTIHGNDLIDFPKKDVLYTTCSKASSELYGKGFTIWKLLKDIDIDRENIDEKISKGFFDLIIFGSICRQKKLFSDFLRRHLISFKKNLIFLDGEDYLQMSWFAILFGRYFKRERNFNNHLFTRKISFSIPTIKIRQFPYVKDILFARHVQCEEAYKIDYIRKNCQKSYAFSSEKEYYENLARAKYAVTMKKGGWDCMRHYEIAANNSVIAFYNLDKKPKWSAPHGLVDMQNVVAFNSAEDLMAKIKRIEKLNLYDKLLKNTDAWIKNNTCEKAARRLLSNI